MELSDEQQAVVDSDARFIVVDAPAGSGKTEVLSRRIERLLAQAPSSFARVLALSYTNRAARELTERLTATLGKDARRVHASTLHAYAHDLLRMHGTYVGLPTTFEVLHDDVDRAACLQEFLHTVGAQPPTDLKAWFQNVDLARARLQDTSDVHTWRLALDLRRAVDYQAQIDKATELLTDPWQIRNERSSFAHIIVDEAQNLTASQYRLLTTLAGTPHDDGCSLALFGDVRQSIVGFAGADAQLISEFASHYNATSYELTRNYRSARAIQRALGSIADALHRPHQGLPGTAEGNVAVAAFRDETDEADSVSSRIQQYLSHGLRPEWMAPGENPTVVPEDIAVLGRSASALKATRAALEAAGIPTAFAVAPQDWLESLPGRALRAAVSYGASPNHGSTNRIRAALLAEAHHVGDAYSAQLLCPADDDVAFSDVVDAALASLDTKREQPGVSADVDTLTEAWQEYAAQTGPTDRTYGSFDLWLNRRASALELPPGVRLLTVHKAQSHQFKAVHVVGMTESGFPSHFAHTEAALQDELSVFYVACSRATRCLALSWARTRANRGGVWKTKPSPFLDYMATAGDSARTA